MKKAVLFDLDGTLWDSADGVCRAWNTVIERHGMEPFITVELMRSMMGKQMDAIAAILFPNQSKEDQLALMDECAEYENELLGDIGGVLFDGLTEVLSVLKEKYSLGIISNCQTGYIETFLKAHSLWHFFDDFESFGATLRPKGENIAALVKRNGYEKAIYVGDTQGDCDAAKFAGLPFVHAAYGFGSAPDADYVIDSLFKLPALAYEVLEDKNAITEDDAKSLWIEEENIAHIHGWDFSHINGRFSEDENFGWDYKELVRKYLKSDMQLLDIDTGGGEELLTFSHPYENTAVTENYAPNVKLCKQTLSPLGIDVRQADGGKHLPFDDESFDMVIDRHGDFNAKEIYRVLKTGGMFITQQVGAENDRELVELLCGKTELPYPEQYLSVTKDKFIKAGFSVLEEGECKRPMRFYEIGALVWFARIIQWEYPDFSVERNFSQIKNAHNIICEKGYVEGSTHRFMLVAKKI